MAPPRRARRGARGPRTGGTPVAACRHAGCTAARRRLMSYTPRPAPPKPPHPSTARRARRSNAYTPPERFGANVDAIIGAGRAAGVKHWLIISPPPVYEAPGKAVSAAMCTALEGGAKAGRARPFGPMSTAPTLWTPPAPGPPETQPPRAASTPYSCFAATPRFPPGRAPALAPTRGCTWSSWRRWPRSTARPSWTSSAAGRPRRGGRTST